MEDTGADAAMGDAVGKRPLLGVGACAEGDNCGISDGWAVGTFELPSGKSFDKTNLQKNISNVGIDADIKNSLMAKLGTPASGGGKRRRTRKSNKKKKSKKSKSKKNEINKKKKTNKKKKSEKIVTCAIKICFNFI